MFKKSFLVFYNIHNFFMIISIKNKRIKNTFIFKSGSSCSLCIYQLTSSIYLYIDFLPQPNSPTNATF